MSSGLSTDLSRLINEGIKKRDRKALAKLLTIIERDPELLRGYYGEVLSAEPKSRVIGITGPPGVGKSSLINRLIKELRRGGYSVAVIAVDPASPLSGGSLLGDRVRVKELDEGVFFRSMSTPPNEDIPWKVILALELLNTAGFDYIILEHPGSGQTNVRVSDLVDLLVVVMQPLTGDDIQLIKAGVTEVGDVYVINKGDLPQARFFFRVAESFIGKVGRDGVVPKVLLVSALSGMGISELASAINSTFEEMMKSSVLSIRRFRRRVMEVYCLGLTYVKLLYDEVFNVFKKSKFIEKVIKGELDVLSASEYVFKELIRRCCTLKGSEVVND